MDVRIIRACHQLVKISEQEETVEQWQALKKQADELLSLIEDAEASV